MTKLRIWTFRIIALMLPLLFFIAIEVLLRVFDYGQTRPLFIQNPNAPQYSLPRPDVVKRYFAEDAPSPNVTIETNFFKTLKPDNSVRLIVQGGSTAAGFPYGFGASIAGMLDYRLKQTYPNTELEVINTALSAVNSYTLLDFADEIIEQKPDAILIYAGHNEYLGILGVGSAYTAANSSAATLMYLKLKELRLFQLLRNTYQKLQSSDANALSEGQSRTTMAKVAKHKSISLDSPLYDAGVDQFKTNMSLLLQKYQHAGIPVFISTIASNLRHQAPFSSNPIPEQAKQGLDILSQQSNRMVFEQLVGIAKSSESAQLYFTIGEFAYKYGWFAEAKNAFIQAKEHDLLRFRAPESVNHTIRQLADTYSANLVEAQLALEHAAPNQIIDNSLMIEHLHPTVEGYFEISDVFYQRIVQSPIFSEKANFIDREFAKAELPIMAAEVYWGEAKIAGLIADYPFTAEPQQPVYPKIDSWSDRLGYQAFMKEKDWLSLAQASLQQAIKNGETRNIVKLVKLLSDAMPYDSTLAYQAGTKLIAHKRPSEAIRYLLRSYENKPNLINTKLALAHAYIESQQFSEGKKWLETVKEQDPDNPVVVDVLPKLTLFLNKKRESANGENN